MPEVEFPAPVWRKSSHSGGGNDCVEVALFAERVGVRDSKNPDAGALSVSPRGWAGLLGAVGRA
ncbi:DUF397 domain-containing protein [Amycolatopsis acidicola]|uniref:DUF397 domain-containing protein n=1 Tax=Amycolatopsis acidicola TaxID=2596893 RepID=A0A5N0V172_9PSEU|nr:DUF397 domain-containing protein [Amycolatopsis acidicola]KAA9158411.1 DUF397 domain-containing protein [Amycolatopsis acidicola]